jgi:hypothetical protein
MLASERWEILLDIKDRLEVLYTQKGEASKSGDWTLTDAIDNEISEVKEQRDGIRDLDTSQDL